MRSQVEKLNYSPLGQENAKQPDGRRVIPLEIGSTVKPWGEIIAIAFLSGERYYFLQAKHGGISMMPWSAVE